MHGGGSARRTRSHSRAAGLPALLPPVTLAPCTVQARRQPLLVDRPRQHTVVLGATLRVASPRLRPRPCPRPHLRSSSSPRLASPRLASPRLASPRRHSRIPTSSAGIRAMRAVGSRAPRSTRSVASTDATSVGLPQVARARWLCGRGRGTREEERGAAGGTTRRAAAATQRRSGVAARCRPWLRGRVVLRDPLDVCVVGFVLWYCVGRVNTSTPTRHSFRAGCTLIDTTLPLPSDHVYFNVRWYMPARFHLGEVWPGCFVVDPRRACGTWSRLTHPSCRRSKWATPRRQRAQQPTEPPTSAGCARAPARPGCQRCLIWRARLHPHHRSTGAASRRARGRLTAVAG